MVERLKIDLSFEYMFIVKPKKIFPITLIRKKKIPNLEQCLKT